MKLLLDEMLTPAIARQLRLKGHDVVAVAEDPDRHALPDAEVLELARREGRAIVASNVRDFRPLHYEAITAGGAGHHGMIFIPGNYSLSRDNIGAITTALEDLLSHHPGDEDLSGGEAWL